MNELMKLKTSFLEPGMLVGKDIYSSSDYLVASEGTVLTDQMISRLKFYSIPEIIIVTPESLQKKEKAQKKSFEKKNKKT